MTGSYSGYVAEVEPEVVWHHGGLRKVRIILPLLTEGDVLTTHFQIVDYSEECQFSVFSKVFARLWVLGDILELCDHFDPYEGVQQEEHVYHI